MADKISKVNVPVQFNDNSLNATSYAWSFGDGNTSTVKSPSHKYTTISPPEFPYNVTHSAVNSCGTTTCAPKTVEVVAEVPPSGISLTVMMIGAAVLGFMMMAKGK